MKLLSQLLIVVLLIGIMTALSEGCVADIVSALEKAVTGRNKQERMEWRCENRWAVDMEAQWMLNCD